MNNAMTSRHIGENSVFSLFHKMNGLIVSIGLDWNNTFSFHHYVEYRVGAHYRRVKGFSGIYVDKSRQAQVKTYTMCVRRTLKVKTYIVPAMSELHARNIIEEVDVGSTQVHFCRASTFFEHMGEIIRTHPRNCHYVEEASLTEHARSASSSRQRQGHLRCMGPIAGCGRWAPDCHNLRRPMTWDPHGR